MAYISDDLRRRDEKAISILSPYADLIKELYEEALAQTLDEEQTQEESIAEICTTIALCLLNDKEHIEFPLSYEEDEESLIIEIATAVNFILALEALVDKGSISREIINGNFVYSISNKKENK